MRRERFFPFLFCFCLVLGALSTSAMAVSVGDEVSSVCGFCAEYGEPEQEFLITEFKSPATCASPAIYYGKCWNCGTVNILELGELDPNNHNFSETSRIPPTCTSSGTVYSECLWCGKSQTETIPALGGEHTWEEISRTEATTATEGSITYQCSVCGTTKSESIPKLEECSHVWVEAGRTEPTATVPGSIQYTCSQCGESRIESIPVLPPEPLDPGSISFINWLGSVVGLFNMTLNSIMGFPALRLFAGVLVFLLMFGLLAKLLQQGRKGRL